MEDEITKPLPTKIGIAIKKLNGFAKNSKLVGAKADDAIQPTRKVVHFGKFEFRSKMEHGRECGTWYEIENYAEFDGQTSEDAALTFIELFKKDGTSSNGAVCFADKKEAPVQPFKKIESIQEVAL